MSYQYFICIYGCWRVAWSYKPFKPPLGGVSLELKSWKCTVNKSQRLDSKARQGFVNPDILTRLLNGILDSSTTPRMEAPILVPNREHFHFLKFIHQQKRLTFVWSSIAIPLCCPPAWEYRPGLHIYREVCLLLKTRCLSVWISL